jgi:hypothetical protein
MTLSISGYFNVVNVSYLYPQSEETHVELITWSRVPSAVTLHSNLPQSIRGIDLTLSQVHHISACSSPHCHHNLSASAHNGALLRGSTKDKTAHSTKVAKDAGYVRKARVSLSRRQCYTHSKGSVSWKKSKNLDAM